MIMLSSTNPQARFQLVVEVAYGQCRHVASSDSNAGNAYYVPHLRRVQGNVEGCGPGDGHANTTTIVTALGDNGGTDYAVKLADDREDNGYTDWFLPSQDELDLMYHNPHQRGLGGFAAENYWSSSETNSNNAWNQNCSTGNQNNNKDNTNRVRAARASVRARAGRTEGGGRLFRSPRAPWWWGRAG